MASCYPDHVQAWLENECKRVERSVSRDLPDALWKEITAFINPHPHFMVWKELWFHADNKWLLEILD